MVSWSGPQWGVPSRGSPEGWHLERVPFKCYLEGFRWKGSPGGGCHVGNPLKGVSWRAPLEVVPFSESP
jgi:hypothetical protein